MERVGRISRGLGQAWLTGLWFFLIAYFAVHAFQGDNSLSALKELEKQAVLLKAEADDVALQRERLTHRTELLGGKVVDPDILEEQVRVRLGFTHPDEVILLLK
ncbi:FtsB family cell division protein [Kordiimonas pumila]|uniref:Septum formation initiator family protein n=1 Tax=Kordiimonas pumila TaxID=2161677 RepID=A0ABV7D2V8_9PROT|nr:septum formation initiator family protein [Kordiimonas pumila]